MRAVFDVNVLLRAVIGSPLSARLIERAADERFDLLSSGMLIAEFADAVRKPRIFGRVDWSAYNALIAFLSQGAELVEIEPPFPACRDPDDGYLLAMANVGRADYLVTNDLDLLSLARFGVCEIVTAEQFARGLETRGLNAGDSPG